MAKFRIQANKVKHVLSANNEIPVFLDALHDDTNYQTHVSRAKFEEVCHDLLLRSSQPITDALNAANLTLADIHMVELIGGGMRVPRVQEEIKKILGDNLDLGMHINSDESMALGAAFHGANISTAFKVRHVGMTDVTPWPIAVSLEDLPSPEESTGGGLFGFGKKKETNDEEEGEEKEEEWSKHATVFKAFGKVGVKKTIAFTHDRDVACALDYEETDTLPTGTDTALERYNVTGIAAFAKEMEEKGLGKPKVSLQFDLDSSGITQLIRAEAVVEEMITVEEEVEVPAEEDEKKGDTSKDEAKDATEEKDTDSTSEEGTDKKRR
jgi:hypoxia up-regulated 1